MMKKVVIIFGPPGSGKGTQAELLARKFNFVHFDTGRYEENLLYAPGALKDPVLQRERKNFDTGKLCTPSWILKTIKQATEKIAQSGQNIVYSGSPRTMFEAFGDSRHQGLIALLNKLYGRKNILILKLNIPDKISIKRNSERWVCSVCGLPLLARARIKNCAFCGGKMRKRSLDNPEVIKIRLKEYRSRTFPVFQELKRRGYKIQEVNAQKFPYLIFQKISEIIQQI